MRKLPTPDAVPAPGGAAVIPLPGKKCPKDFYRDSIGLCLPECGGAVCDAGKKWGKEIKNGLNDLKVWVETGKCGGDICDAFDAAVKFGVAQIEDKGPTFERAGKRLKEGKPLDAVWHIATDDLKNTNENASEAVNRSSVLAMTAQVAASAYGGPAGAAAYTAWLTYNRTGGDIGAALKAGIISGLSAYALQGVNNMQIEDPVRGAIARSVLTGSINGAAVAASGGSQEEIRQAMVMGVATVLIREGYRELTSSDLDRQRLQSSQGQAYCKGVIPDPSYFTGGSDDKGCLPPPKAYTRNAAGKVLDRDGNVAGPGHPPKIDQTELDYTRPHVGTWSDSTEPKPLNITEENSGVMTGFSRAPGVNAMAVGHDKLVDDYLTTDIKVDVGPAINKTISIATIPPSLTLTYVGTGEYVHEMISENVAESRSKATNRETQNKEPGTPTVETVSAPVAADPAPSVEATAKGDASKGVPPTEVLHIVCGKMAADNADVSKDLQLVIEAGMDDAHLRPTTSRICEVSQLVRGIEYRFWHAHHQRNSCFKKADDVVRRYQKRGLRCFGSTGLRTAAS